MPRSTPILLADPIAKGIAVAAVAVAVAVSGGTDCRGSYCCGTDRRSAIRIIPATIGHPTVGRSAIRRATSIGRSAIRRATSIGRSAIRGATSDACRANPSASAGTATTVSERVIRNEGHPHKEGGC